MLNAGTPRVSIAVRAFRYDACWQESGSTICKPYVYGQVCASSPVFAICTAYTTSEEYFVATANLFCGTGFPDRGSVDGDSGAANGAGLDGGAE